MTEQEQDRELLEQYLLGQLPAAEAEVLDERSIADDEFADRLEAVENDLVDAYARNELAGPRRERFESHYLQSPRRRERVEFAKSLMGAVDRRRGGAATKVSKPPLRWVMPLAAALLLAAGVRLFWENRQLRRERDTAEASRQSAEQRARELEKKEVPQTPSRSPIILAFHLAPQTRGVGQIANLALTGEVDYASVELELEPNGYAGFEAALKDVSSGKAVWSSGPLRARRRGDEQFLTVGLPATLFSDQTYVLEVTGVKANGTRERAGDYPFRVVRE